MVRGCFNGPLMVVHLKRSRCLMESRCISSTKLLLPERTINIATTSNKTTRSLHFPPLLLQCRPALQNPDFRNFVSDGELDEWNVVSPVATRFTNGKTLALRLFADRDKLNILLEGADNEVYTVVPQHR